MPASNCIECRKLYEQNKRRYVSREEEWNPIEIIADALHLNSKSFPVLCTIIDDLCLYHYVLKIKKEHDFLDSKLKGIEKRLIYFEDKKVDFFGESLSLVDAIDTIALYIKKHGQDE